MEENGSGAANMKRDEAMTRALDRLILYLRVVHSFDYYNATEYALEVCCRLPAGCLCMGRGEDTQFCFSSLSRETALGMVRFFLARGFFSTAFCALNTVPSIIGIASCLGLSKVVAEKYR